MRKKPNTYREFILNNYEDLAAATEVFQTGKKLIREWVMQAVFNALKNDKHFEEQGFNVEMDDTEIWWYLLDDKLWWDKNKKTGLYFAFETTTDYADHLVLPTEDHVYIGLYHEIENNIDKSKAKKLRFHINKYKQIIKKEKFEIPDDDGYLVGYAPQAELNLNAIKENLFPEDIIEKIKTLTDTVLPIIQKYKIS